MTASRPARPLPGGAVAGSRRRGRHLGPTDRGTTLIELLITIVIMGVGVVGILGGVLALTKNADRTDRLTTAANVVQGYAEQLKGPLDDMEYEDCALPVVSDDEPGSYPAFEHADGVDLEARVVDVDYLDALSATGAVSWAEDCPEIDGGLQRLTIEVTTMATSGPITERVTLIKRDARCEQYSQYENPDRGPC